MTVIVGLVAGETIYMGCDSLAASGWSDGRISLVPKVFKTGNFIIGYTDSFRMGQILQHYLTVELQSGGTDEHYMVTKFVEAVRECLKQNGYMIIENNREQIGLFLVGYKSKLYQVNSDLQLNSYSDGFDAIGSGSELALGAMAALENMLPEPRLIKAMEIVSRFAPGVRGPFNIEVLQPNV